MLLINDKIIFPQNVAVLNAYDWDLNVYCQNIFDCFVLLLLKVVEVVLPGLQ